MKSEAVVDLQAATDTFTLTNIGTPVQVEAPFKVAMDIFKAFGLSLTLALCV